MFQQIIKTTNHISGPITRVVLALVLFSHGTQKMLGWFGGRGFTPSVEFLARVYLIPKPLGVLLIFFEVFGAIFLLLGLFGRIAALGTVVMMVVAGIDVYRLYGHYFMNWASSSTYKGEGIEYHLIVVAASVALLVHGSGALSLDRLLSRRREPALRASGTASGVR